MKKIVVLATCIAAVAANALPTYEPFTEYNALVAANATNSIDLCTSGLIAPSGEPWLNQSFTGTVGTNLHGLDIQVTNWSTSVFTYNNLQSLLPSDFPGLPSAGNSITTLVVNPAQPFVNAAASPNIVGNSAVLQFAQDITRPATGTKTLFISYLFAVAQQGQTGGGNIGRYLNFVASSNIVEGKGSTGFYQTWQAMNNTFAINTGPRYFGHGVFLPSNFDLEPQDSSVGKTALSSYTVFPVSYNTPYFVVGEYVFVSAAASAAGTKDTNIIWVNPSTTAFGGQTPTSLTMNVDPMLITMSDVGGMVLLDRPGSGQSGGVGTNYIANLMLGSTWSFVTGGPEFTNQPANVVTNLGGTASFTASATAAGQSVTYQWQKVTATSTNNIGNGSGAAGGRATVSGATSGTLTLAGITSGDLGSYQVVASASGTSLSLASSSAALTEDPLITAQPEPVSVFPGDTATFSVTASTQFGSLTYQWLLNGAPLSDGTQGDGSIVSGATTSTLSIANFQSDESGDIVSVALTNGALSGEVSAGAAVTALSDPGITAEPEPETVNYGTTATFTATAQTGAPHAPLAYAWYKGGTLLADGLQADGSTVSGAQGTSSGPILNSTLTLANVSYLDDGQYSLSVTNTANGTATSSAATLTVNDPYIGTQPPATVEVALGGNGSISVSAAGSGATYQWYSVAGGPVNNAGDFSGAGTSTLRIIGAQASDAGTYYVIVTGNNGSLQSSNAILYVDTALANVAVTPQELTQQTGTHLAFAGTITGGAGGLTHSLWEFNGTPLANGTQADGTSISGAGTSTLVVSNLHAADSGSYALVVSNATGSLTNTGVLTVSTGLLGLSTNNLEVVRVGDGSEVLSGATGNTLYLDQFQTNGNYVSTIMVPDSGNSALIVPGPASGSDGQNEAYLTLSSNQAYLNFAGYGLSYPYLGTDVTTPGAPDVRGIAAVDALGFFTLAYTNWGLLSGGDHYIRSAFSTDGLTNFWVAGAASDAIDYAQAGPGGSAYAQGSGIIGISSTATGPRNLGLLGRNLAFTDNGEANVEGLSEFVGAPELFSTTANVISFGSPADFASSPDTNTIYITDDGLAIPGGATTPYQTGYGGGIQRWDWNGSSYAYSYNLDDVTNMGTNGLRGLAVYFPTNITTWGPNVNGAVLYATTTETQSNRLIEFIDNGPSTAAPTLLETAGPNEFLQGVRFGPQPLPVSIIGTAATINSDVGASNTLTANVTGDGPLFYQWQFDGTNITGATTASLVFNNLQVSNSGTYTLIVTNAISSNSVSTVLSVVPAPPVFVISPQSRVETAGDHLSFVASATGTMPIHYQWESNGVVLAGATNTYYSLSNIVVANSATYSVVLTNIFGTNTNSATLVVTTDLQDLQSNNLVVARIGDGVEPLSSVTANTLYLDQFTTTGVYSNTIMIPDFIPSNQSNASPFIVAGGTTEGPYGSVLTTSADGSYLNFAGFNSVRPPLASLAGSAIFRAVGGVDAWGDYNITINETIYNALDVFDSAVSLDGFTEFWTTGSASAPPGVKYADAATEGSAGGNVAVGGSASGTRVVNIIAGNVVYSDAGSSPPGIWAFSGEPTATTTPGVLISEPNGSSPNDFAASPDTTSFPPATSTVYVGDNNSIAAGGGIQRYDWNGSGYTKSYTLGTGTNSAVGASDLVVDFSANTTWGPGITGAIVYATTAGTSSNSLIKIVDNGPSSTATVLETANANEILRGVRFGPTPGVVAIVGQPGSTTAFVGGTATFTVTAMDGPFTYQWQFNGVNLTNGPSPTGSGAIISGAQSATLTISNVGGLDDNSVYDVIVNNPNPNGTAYSSPVALGVPVEITGYPATSEYVLNGSNAVFTVAATGGTPLTYQWSGPCGPLSDGADPCGGTGIIAGSSTATLTITNASTADDGSYVVTVSNNDPSSADNTAKPAVLTVLTSSPQFASLTVNGSSPQLTFSGTAGTAYRVWGTTNLSLRPITSKWTLLGSGTFSGGVDTFAITPANADEFYVITQP